MESPPTPIKKELEIMREDLDYPRMVVNYFGAETKAQLVDHFADQLVSDGLPMMRHSESLYRTSSRFFQGTPTLRRAAGIYALNETVAGFVA